MAVEKADIEKVHTRIDDLVKVNTKIQVSLAEVTTTLKGMKIPEQPCKTLTEHIEEHKESRNMVKRPLINHIIDIVKLGIVFIAGWLFSRKI